MKELTGKIQKTDDGEYGIDGDVDAHFDAILEHFGEGTNICVAFRKYIDPSVAELCIDIGDGQAVVTIDNSIEFTDCGKLSLADLEFLVGEAKAFIEYRDARNLIKDHPMLEAIKPKPITDGVKMIERHKAGYDVYTEEHGNKVMKSAYTLDGEYIGSPNTAYFLYVEKGIKPELANESDHVCSIGFSDREQKWFGWAHQTIRGFGVGDVVKAGDCTTISGWADVSLPVGFVAKDMDDAKRMAIAFADSVS